MTQAVLRAIGILGTVAESPSGRSLTEIAAAMKLSKATSFRLAQTLCEAQLLRHDRARRRYFPGDELFRLSGYLLQNERVRELALRHMHDLREETHETISLVIAKGMERVTVEVLPAVHELRLVPALHSSKPIHVGAPGKALLAYRSPREIERVIEETKLRAVAPGSITAPGRLLRELARVRQQGYATSIEETVPGGAAVAAPIFDGRGEAVAALNIYGPRFRFRTAVLRRYGRLAAQAAVGISAELGAPACAGKQAFKSA